MDRTPYANFTDEELIRKHRVSGDPIVHELANRLADASDRADTAEQEVENAKKAINLALGSSNMDLEGAATEVTQLVDKHEAEIERLEDDYEDRIAKLDEQIAHERERIKEFHDENQKFIAEIKRLKSAQATPEEKERTMLEQQIEKLTERVAAVETKQDRTNELLGEILTAIREGGTTPPEPAQSAKMEVVADNSDKKKKASTSKAKKPAKEETDDVPSYTLDDVRDAYLAVQQEHSKDAAVSVIKEIAGDVKNITHVPEDKFAEIVTAFQAFDQKEAA